MEDIERKQVVEGKLCKDCGDLFEITAGEKEFYESKGMVLPDRCKTCRDKRNNTIRGAIQMDLSKL